MSDIDLAVAYADHGPFVYGLALEICGPNMATRITEDVFLRLRTGPEEFVTSGSATLRTVLMAATHRAAVDAVRIERAIDRLPDRQREALITTVHGRRTYRETAVVVRSTENTVKKRFRDGLRLLRHELA